MTRDTHYLDRKEDPRQQYIDKIRQDNKQKGQRAPTEVDHEQPSVNINKQ